MASAQAAARSAGFASAVSGTGEQIVSQLPAAGALMRKGSMVMLYAEGEGEEPWIQTPDLTGLSVQDAARRLAPYNLTLEADGHLLFGGNIVEAVETLQALGASAVGLNCSVGPDQLEAVVASMKAVAEVPLIVKPNAGMPVMDERGNAHYDMTPEQFADAMRRLVDAGADIIGGCCGTGPEYIARLAEMFK